MGLNIIFFMSLKEKLRIITKKCDFVNKKTGLNIILYLQRTIIVTNISKEGYYSLLGSSEFHGEKHQSSHRCRFVVPL